jgi:hypothetical protein
MGTQMLCDSNYICVAETLRSPFDHRFSQANIHDLAADLLNLPAIPNRLPKMTA